ncbi:MAG TPA: hypothetical protein VHU44_08140, partial [Acidobacteriaceae bacterium]|nr:hypothetical protein [Acidobacteriaceae bacterium]
VGEVQKSPGFTLETWDISAILENSGTTPAINAVAYYQARAFFSDPNAVPNLRDNPEINEETFVGPKSKSEFPVTINPHGSQALGRMFPSDENVMFGGELQKMTMNGRKLERIGARPFYAWGWIVYNDTFKDTEVHVTEFCQRLSGARMTDAAGGYALSWNACGKHNCVDRGCSDYGNLVNTHEQKPKNP